MKNLVTMRVISIFALFSLMFANPGMVGTIPASAQADLTSSAPTLTQQETTGTPLVETADQLTDIPSILTTQAPSASQTAAEGSTTPPAETSSATQPDEASSDTPAPETPPATPTIEEATAATTSVATSTEPTGEPLITITASVTPTPAQPKSLQQLAQLTDCSAVDVPQNECSALVMLYNETGGSEWTDQSGWLQTNTICSWYGVICTNGHVTVLDLDNNNLIGFIPSDLENLTQLNILALYHNQLTNGIPSQLGNLSQLTSLALSSNLLTGPIPAELGNLTHLLHLSLSGNNLSGSIPSKLGNLTQLTDLELNSTQLTGPIPPQLGNLSNLTILDLSSYGISGSVPSQLGNLTQLLELDISSTGLSGALPVSLENLTLLQDFFFSGTSLCEPTDTAFQTWLTGITSKPGGNVKATGYCVIISGAVNWNGTGLMGVTIAVSDTTISTTTASNGSYNLNIPSGTSADIIPTLAWYTFNPVLISFSNLVVNQAGQNFIAKATPTIFWNNPANITFGTALTTAQLDATASVAGTFDYTPKIGTFLNSGSQTLHVDFTPLDTTDFNSTSKSVTINVNPASLRITASNGTMVYGDIVPVITPSYSGLKAGDTAPASLPTCSTTATSTSAIGTYISSCSGAVDLNYNITYTGGAISVTARALTVTAKDQTKPFGDPFIFTGTEFNSSGLVNPDTITNMALTSAGAPSNAPVGLYNIIPSAPLFGLGTARNYTITYVYGKLDVYFDPNKMHNISGQVTVGTPPTNLPNVTVAFGSLHATTAGDGAYTITTIPPGTKGSLVPLLPGYTFKPVSIAIPALYNDLSGKNFAATQSKFSISGRVTVNGKGLANVVITTTSSQTNPPSIPIVVSNSSGAFTIPNLLSTYNYTLTPVLAGYSFNPTTINNLLKNQTGIPIIATLLYENISGIVNYLQGTTIQIRYGTGKTQLIPTGSGGSFTISNLPQNISYTIVPFSPNTPFLPMFRFSPVSLVIPAGNGSTNNAIFDAAPQVVMSGNISVQGKAIKGVTVSGGNFSTITDNSGNYSLWVPIGVSMTPRAKHPYFTFSDAAQITPFNSFTQSWFTARVVLTGQITLNGAGFQGVTLSVIPLKGDTATSDITDDNGNYLLIVDANSTPNQASFVVTPALTGYTFSPKSQIFTTSTNTIKNFIAIPNKWNVSGKVASGLIGVSGVEIVATIDGVDHRLLTNSSGAFILTGVPYNASGTLTAKKYGYTIIPDNIPFTLGNANLTGLNFNATALPLTKWLSGTTFLGSTTTPLANVTITMLYNGDVIATHNTNKDGNYTLGPFVADAGYVVMAALNYYDITPSSNSIDLSDSSDVQNFSATRVAKLSGKISGLPANTRVEFDVSGGVPSPQKITVDSLGNYAISDLPTGYTYTFTPVLSGYKFTPAGCTILIGPTTAVVIKNFTAVPN